MTSNVIDSQGRTDLTLSGDPDNGLVRTELGVWSRPASGPSMRAIRTASSDVGAFVYWQFNAIEWQTGVTLDTSLGNAPRTGAALATSRMTAPIRGLYHYGACVKVDSADVAVDTGIGANILLDDTYLLTVIAADGILGASTPPPQGYALNPHGWVWMEAGDGIIWQIDGDSVTAATTIQVDTKMWLHWIGDYATTPAATTDSAVSVEPRANGGASATPRLAGATVCGGAGLLSRANRAYHCTVDRRYYTSTSGASPPIPWERQTAGPPSMWDPGDPTKIKLPLTGYWLVTATMNDTGASNIIELRLDAGLGLGQVIQSQSDVGIQHAGPRTCCALMRVTTPGAFATTSVGCSATLLCRVNGARDPGMFMQATWLGPLT